MNQPWLPLTAAQQGLWFAQMRDPRSPAWSTAEVVEIEGPLDPEALAQAVVATHQDFEQLRTRYRSTGHGPEQQVLDGLVHPWQVVDLQGAMDPRAAAQEWCDALVARPLDLPSGEVVRAALLRVAPRVWWFVHVAHHVVLDGYGVVQVLRRIAERCTALSAGTAPRDLAPAPLAEVVAADARVRAAETDSGAEEFWAARLADCDDVVALAGRLAEPAPRHLRASIEVSQPVQEAVVGGARRLGVSWADLVQTAVGLYLARCAGTDRTRIGLPLMNRSRAGDGALPSASAVCTAMNVLPATVHVSGQDAGLAPEPATGLAPGPATGVTWRRALADFGAEQQALRAHPFTRQEALARQVQGRDGQLFGAQVNLIPFALELRFAEDVRGTVRNLTAGPVEDMTVCLRGVPGRGRSVRLELDAHPDLYSVEQVEAHLARLLHWLEVCATAEAEADVSDLPLLGAAEQHRVLVEFNDTAVPRTARTLAQRFAEQCERSPQAVALIDRDVSVTYADLGEQVDRLARALLMAGVHTGEVVAVLVPRSIEWFVAVHAVQRIGGVHLPMDATQPQERLRAMLAEAECTVAVVPGTLASDDASADGPFLPAVLTRVTVDSSAPQVSLPPVPSDVAAPAYLLFTSGSTGRPKGVLVQHEAIDNRLAWMQHQFPMGPGNRVLAKTPVTFDVSVWEHFWPFQVGATVVVARPAEHRDPRALADLVVEGHVDLLHFVPSMLRAFVADRPSRERVLAARSPDPTHRRHRRHQVRAVVCSGEALTADLVAECREVFGVAPVNLYGPTEAAVDVTCAETEDLAGSQVPIGRPIWNTSAYVLDARGRPVPIGSPGRLWLGGVQVALGYVNRSDLTAERFVQDPFASHPEARMYDTGDLACWQPDGALLYLGRSDDQVKVRGQRVELGEVEAALAGTPGVSGVVAGLVAEDLVVWFVATDAGPDADADGDGRARADLATGEAAAQTCVAALQQAAAAALPEGVRPTRWVPVAEIPVSSSGKADRRHLVAATPDRAAAHGAAPQDLVEQRLCALFAQVLDLPAVPADADFFSLGGDSLKVLALLGLVEDAFGREVDLRTVFAAPTPGGLAQALRGGGSDDLAEVVVLRPGADDVPPLVLLPPAGGLGWCYTGLLPHLPPGLGVLTVQAPGIEAGQPEPVADLGALARRQLAAVRGVLGERGFHVAGWSLGGMAAHELAALAPDQVGAVVALDSYPAQAWAHLETPTEAEALLGVVRLGGAETELEALLAERTPPPVLDRALAAEALTRAGSALAQLPAPVLDGAIASVVEAARIVRTSGHTPLAGDLDVVVASAPRPEDWLDALAWQQHTAGTIRVHEVPTTHGDLLRAPHAGQVARVLIDRMAAHAPGSRALVGAR